MMSTSKPPAHDVPYKCDIMMYNTLPYHVDHKDINMCSIHSFLSPHIAAS